MIMKYSNCPIVQHANIGCARQRSLAQVFGVPCDHNDDIHYDEGSDLVVNGVNISVKSARFSLMSGNLCKGLTSFDEIWSLFAHSVHSDLFAYMTLDFTCYIMTLDTFKEFVYGFCTTTRESEKNGGQVKIRCKHETKKMIRWLEERAA